MRKEIFLSKGGHLPGEKEHAQYENKLPFYLTRSEKSRSSSKGKRSTSNGKRDGCNVRGGKIRKAMEEKERERTLSHSCDGKKRGFCFEAFHLG